MTLDEEADLVGREVEEVPRVEPDEKCRGMRTERDDDGVNRFVGYCRNGAGKGTDHYGEGRCKFHAGCSTGAPKGNQNRATHSLNADPQNYSQSLSHEQKEFVRDVSASIQDRIRANTGTVDSLDRVMAKRIAIELHIVSKASNYVQNESGLSESIVTEHGSHEREAALFGEIRTRDKDIFSMLKQVGVLDDPESQKADSIESWRSFVEDGQNP